MKYINCKNIALATVLLTSTANAYFDQDSLKSWSDSDLKHTGLKLADKVFSDKGNRDYNFFKLAVLSQEEERRGLNPTFAANPEDKLTFGVYEYLLSKGNPVLAEFVTLNSREDILSLNELTKFTKALGIQAKTAPKLYVVDTTSHVEPEISHEISYKSTIEFHKNQYNNASSTYGISSSSLPGSVPFGNVFDPAHLSHEALKLFEEKMLLSSSTPKSMEDTSNTKEEVKSEIIIESSVKNDQSSRSNSPKREISESKQEEILSEDSVVDQNPTRKVYVDFREIYLKEKGWSMDPVFIADRFLRERLEKAYGKETTELLFNGPAQSVSLEEKKDVRLEKKEDRTSELEVVIESSKEPLLTDVRKSKPTMKNKRPPTLKREKKVETTQETPVVTTPMEVEVEKPETKVVETPVEKSITPPLPVERENVKPQEEKKTEIVSPIEDAAPTEQELKLRRLSKMGVNMMGGMGAFNPGAVILKKAPPKK